jgi:hypothetical protein
MEKKIDILSTYGKAGRLDGETIQRKQAPSITVEEGWLPYHELDRCLCWLVANPDTDPARGTIHRNVLMELRAKRRGYQEQDKKRDWNPARVLVENEIAEKMLIQKQKCFHCGVGVHVLYRDRYDPLQWSIDRLDNDKGHTRDNVVVSCMRCNLRRGRLSIQRFKGTYTTVAKES